MNITCYFINWNDSFYFPFLEEHYGKFCNRIIMLDNHSTDNSISIARSLGFDTFQFGVKGILDDQMYCDIKNQFWKGSRNKGVDYVIVCDADEFVRPDSLIGTAPRVTGFNLISEELPVRSIFEINTGDFSKSYSKQAIFNPDEIQEINFVHGCHENHMTGNITTEGSASLFHFRQIGGVRRLIDRHASYRPRKSNFNEKNGLGIHYGRKHMTVEEVEQFNQSKRDEWQILKAQAKVLW